MTVRRPLPSGRHRWMRAIALCAAALAAGVAGPAAHGEGADDARRPSLGYAYPAGGRQGTVVQVLVGGQNLRGTRAVHVSGEGVTAQVVRFVRPLGNQQQGELRRRIAGVRAERRAAARPDRGRGRGRAKPKAAAETPEPEIRLPDHPLLHDLETRSDRELDEIAARFIDDRSKKQINRQIAETVEIEVEIAPGTPPGWRELRLVTAGGLTDPVRFRVDALPEVNEREPLGRPEWATPLVDLPVLLNGQIQPGDIDTFRVRAKAGSRLVLRTAARDLVPFLADAVPGWFQAVLTVRDERGNEIAYSDDSFGYDPDPRLVVDVPRDGNYEVEIRDSIYRGREDFVYRIAIEEDPDRAWTPSRSHATLPALPTASAGRSTLAEAEPNDDVEAAQGLLLPQIVSGAIAYPGDVDVFVFQGRAGQEVVVDVDARDAGSPLDSVVHLVDPSGRVVAWNDDFDEGAPGLMTHAADSYIRTQLPADGAYTVRLTDVCGQGGALYGYRLRIGAPEPDFHLVVTPSALTLAPGATTPFRVHAIRRDGHAGPIDVALADAPDGFVLSGARIPAGRNTARLTLTAPLRGDSAPVALRVVGRAPAGEGTATREAVPADVRMQAFLYQHLAPAQQFAVLVTGRKRAGQARRAAPDDPVRLRPGRPVDVAFVVPGLSSRTVIRPALDSPHPLVTLAGWELEDGRLTLRLTALEAPETAPAEPVADNVITAVWIDVKDAKGVTRRIFAGHLPAVAVSLQR